MAQPPYFSATQSNQATPQASSVTWEATAPRRPGRDLATPPQSSFPPPPITTRLSLLRSRGHVGYSPEQPGVSGWLRELMNSICASRCSHHGQAGELNREHRWLQSKVGRFKCPERGVRWDRCSKEKKLLLALGWLEI